MANKSIKKASPYIISSVVNILYGFISCFFVLSYFIDPMFYYIHHVNTQTSFTKVCLSFLGMVLINCVMGYIFNKNILKENKVIYWSVNLAIALKPYIWFFIGLLLPMLL